MRKMSRDLPWVLLLGFIALAQAPATAQTRPAADTRGQAEAAHDGSEPAQAGQQAEAERIAEEAASAEAAATQEAVEKAKAIQVTVDPEAVEREARASANNDARIAAAVTAALARSAEIEDLVVDVNAGVVALSGNVAEESQRARAVNLAKGVDGVVEVENQLELTTDLRTRLRATMRELQLKLTRLVAGIPVLLVAIAIVALGAYGGRFVAYRLPWLGTNSGNPYLEGLVRRGIQLLLLVSSIIVALDLLGTTKLVGALLGSAGLVGLTLGFAFRDIAENYIAGFMLSLRRPFAPGDHVVIDGNEGRVVSLSSRATILMTPDGNHLRLPNATVFKAIILNYTANPKRRVSVATDIDAGESIQAAQDAGLAAIDAIEGILDDPPPRMIVRGYDSSGIKLEFQAWIDQTHNDPLKTRSAATHAIKRAFAERDIEPARSVQYVVQAGEDPRLSARAPRHEPPVAHDTTVDAALEPQLEHAQQEQADINLIANGGERSE